MESNSKVPENVIFSAMIFANMTLKTENFTGEPPEYVDFSLGLLIERDKLDGTINRIFSQFRRSYQEIFVAPILTMILVTFLLGLWYVRDP
jgi:hypothetical protein